MTNEIEQTINMLSSKFGKVGMELFNTMVSAQRFDAIVGVVFGILMLSLGCISLKKYGVKDEYADMKPVAILFFFLIFFGVLFIFLNLQGIFYPEAVMIKTLLAN